jgi:hypothetical protein
VLTIDTQPGGILRTQRISRCQHRTLVDMNQLNRTAWRIWRCCVSNQRCVRSW